MLELTTGETIYQAAVDLHNAGRVITRQGLQKITSIKMGIIDDHVTRMVDAGRMRRVSNGVLELVEQFPVNRVYSKTVLPNGVVKFELGDQLLEATPGEVRELAGSLLGEALLLANLRGEREVSDTVSRMERQLQETLKQLGENKKRLDDMTRQIARMQERAQNELSFGD